VKTALPRRLIVAAAIAGVLSTGPTVGMLVNAATASAQPTDVTQHSGPNYVSITGARIGAPGEQEVSRYGGSRKHEWVEHQLYGPGVVDVPRVDNTVRQSR
jgi:hypothetical protein